MCSLANSIISHTKYYMFVESLVAVITANDGMGLIAASQGVSTIYIDQSGLTIIQQVC